jgi:methyltransferase (TIGR00027 family)
MGYKNSNIADKDHVIGTTADGLVVIRSGIRAREIGVLDPFAFWFVTEEGHRLVQVAKKTDQVYEEFNLSRFKFTTSRLRFSVAHFEQMVFLGSGFDCRAVWLDEFQSGRVTVFEVDTPDKLGQKIGILRKHGVRIPAWNKHIMADLKNHVVPGLLVAKGFQLSLPTLVLLEGVLFYLPPEISRSILHPEWLKLCPGSTVLFDFWSDSRVRGLNVRVKEKLGTGLFHRFPFSNNPNELKEELARLGYHQINIIPLEELAQEYYRRKITDEFPDSWFIVEATV